MIEPEPFFPPQHVAWPNGYPVHKPEAVQGNCIPDGSYIVHVGDTGSRTDAPQVVIWHADDSWHTQVSEYAPGPGPGDFRHQFLTERDAVDDVIRYFFSPDSEIFSFIESWSDQQPPRGDSDEAHDGLTGTPQE